jgi:DNA adenine methylase
MNHSELTYVEPFAGSACVLLNKQPSREEALNDLDLGVVQMLRIIRDQPAEFMAAVKKIEQTEEEFYSETTPADNEFNQAVREFSLRLLSKGGLKKAFAPARRNEFCTRWIKAASERLQKVYLFHKPALDVIRAFNTSDVILYCDPPPMPDTREPKKEDLEMSADEHIELAQVLRNFKGHVAISGKSSPLYNRLYKSWRCVRTKKTDKTTQEWMWLNY